MPRTFRARQLFPRPRVADIRDAVMHALSAIALPDLGGRSVALTAGSRGVANIDRILLAAIEFLKNRGARPFIVPAMGSHANADAAAQTAFIAGYGITEATMGVPVRSSMEVVELGRTSAGYPVYCDRNAAQADFIMPVNRIKPHTDFKGEIESGLCKMMVIGLGKHQGASLMHSRGFAAFAELIPVAAEAFIANAAILCGLGILENAYDETMRMEALLPGDLIQREKTLLIEAKKAMPRFHVDMDILIVDEIGKDISGAGMDSNVTGRVSAPLPGFDAVDIERIVVLGLTRNTHGNASGIGVADFITREVAGEIDLGATYTNALTSRSPEGPRLPIIANTDLDAVRMALHCCFRADTRPEAVKILQIRDTLRLSHILLSEGYLPLMHNDSRFEILSEPAPMPFDAAGRLRRVREIMGEGADA